MHGMNTFVITGFNDGMLPLDGSSVVLMPIDVEAARDVVKNAAIMAQGFVRRI